ncbi:major tail protein [Paenibacillus sp. D9]|uniref:major tail protein n=1 Tax=Paenibacillus sp. D9 TaxID=665792 RepID=UPI00067663AF|nr:major tail protein [Paenibacillus sp. D9]
MAKGTGKGTRIGLDMLHYAIITTAADGTETYGTPKALKDVRTATVSPETNTESLYADDRLVEVATSLGGIELELEVRDIPTEDYAALTGATIDANGVVVDKSTDNAPFVAVGWRSRKTNGAYRHYWLYKGKFGLPEDEFATKEDSASFQTPKITGTFMPREDGQWRAKVDSDGTDVPVGIISSWFTKVYDGTPVV